MEIKKILVSQPYPSSEKSPYFDLQKKFGVELTFKPFIRIESLSTKEFREQKVAISAFTAIVLTSRTAVDNFFKICTDIRITLSEELQFFCLSDTIANYLQKFITYRKRKVHYSKTGELHDLILVMKKHNSEKFLMPVADVHKEDPTMFAKAKLSVTPVVMYRTVSSEFTPEEIKSYDMIVFFTPAGIQSLFLNDPQYEQGDQIIAVFGPTTAKSAEEKGLRLDIAGPTPEQPSMAGAIATFLQQNNSNK